MSKRSIVHIEVPINVPDKDPQFYADVFGWEIQSIPEMDYVMFGTGSVGGGFSKVDENIKPGDVIVYIESDDIEADLKKIETGGGKTVLPKTEIPNTGWFAWFTDPTGNKLALYTSMNNS